MAANCTAYGSRNFANFSHPLPTIGLYVAAASLVCAICIGLDLYRSLLSGRSWIASKFFSLNAATLTVLAVAVKIPSDITTPMSGLVDQLAKLSGTVLVSITMNHVMPSLGSMDGVGILSNVIALGILVVTLFVNVWFQIFTGVVLEFRFYNTLFAITMLILYVIFVSYSLMVLTTKRLLEKQYETKHEKILQDMSRDVGGRISLDWLKNHIDKYWLMALTSSPDYTLLSSGMCSVSAILCYGNVGVNFMQALAHLFNSGGRICYISSDYDWSVTAILSFQCLAISMGLIASVMRGNNSRPGSSFSTWRGLPKIEKHWVQLLVEWKQAPLEILESKGRRMRKVIHSLKNFVLGFLLKFQICVVLTSKVFLLACIWIKKHVISYIHSLSFMLLKRCVGAACCYCSCCGHKEVVEAAEERLDYDLREYVLHIEGEEEEDNQTAEVVRRWRKHPQKWTESGRTNKPKHLLDLLENNTHNLFAPEGIDKFVELYDDKEKPKCWALPLATLAAIARATLSQCGSSTEQVMAEVSEGLRYVRFVERSLGDGQQKKIQKATDMVWEGVDLYGRWLDVDLNGLTSKEWIDTVRKIKDIAEKHLEEWKYESNPLRWPTEAVAANCLLQISKTILSDGVYRTELALLEQLRVTIGKIIGSCLKNLPLAILVHCSSGEFGAREERVRKAAVVLGETEEIIKVLEEEGVLDMA